MDINTVVVGFDGSECAQRAVDAASVVLNPGGTMHLVSAYDAPSVREVTEAYAAVPKEFTASVDLMSEPRNALSDEAQRVSDLGITVIDHFVDAEPASAILQTVEDVSADMVVVGSRGLGRASAFVRGSVSTKVAHHAQVDFMVIH